ncbi:MAG: trypsin-like serine protease [Pseudomonadota bacterium]
MRQAASDRAGGRARRDRRVSAWAACVAALSVFFPADPALADGALDRIGAWLCGSAAASSNPVRPAQDQRRFSTARLAPDAPWVAKLEIIEERFADGAISVSHCSAAAIAPLWLATAAHCVGDQGWIGVTATLGDQDAGGPNAFTRSAILAVCHADYRPGALAMDIALVRLDQPLPEGFPLLRLAGWREAARLSAGAVALSAGWGRVGPNAISRRLRMSELRIVDPMRAQDAMIVAAPLRHEQSLCVGESGAPLVADLGRGPALLGVFSSVDAFFDDESRRIVELCDGFEARSYFTALGGLRGWVEAVMRLCDGRREACAAGADRR